MIFETRGINIFIEGEFDPDKTEKPPLIFLHGFTLSSREWLPLFESYKENFQPLTIDIIGHGRSSSPADESKYTFECFASILKNVLGEMSIQAAHWIGYSLGS
ncbi:MAG: alpha/beta fold hydrolase, partial [Candidatus Marinimicrobia bacterium]|nr:alpha/beta fold hydrolase [Candidatus Neomarinimicrobiota bacterium]